jgi:hypothetical protein
LWAAVSELAKSWLGSIQITLERAPASRGFPKTFNDPIWGVIELYPWEVVLLDSLLLQRLRGVRQLGMAHLVYPGATHDRLEHMRGVVAAAARMVTALKHNAEHRRKFGAEPDDTVPLPSDTDVWSVRLAALVHDIGHGPFSHATEPLLGERFEQDFKAAEEVLRTAFVGVSRIAPSETLAVLVVLTDAMREVLDEPRLGIPRDAGGRELAPAIAARLLGSHSHLDAPYLSGVISGPLDADKLDYMARDSHHAGLPVGLDMDRLISKLEVVTVTHENAPASLRERVARAPKRRIYEVGISLAGLGAYEQMIITRVILYDRLYHHHKVRAAEAMVRQLVRLSEQEAGKPFTLADLLSHHSDDTMLEVWGGRLYSNGSDRVRPRSTRLATALLERRIHHRAFAFASRFIREQQGLPEQERRDTRVVQWDKVLKQVAREEKREELSRSIYEKALALANALPAVFPEGKDIQAEDVLVDFPGNKAVVRSDILTRSDSGQVNLPNLFFNPNRWSEAYEQQKQCGFVFAALPFVSLVALASKLVFFERFQVVMTEQADLASKTFERVPTEWFRLAAEKNLCTGEAASQLSGEQRPALLQLVSEDFVLPDSWSKADPCLTDRLSSGFQAAFLQGVTAEVRRAILETLNHLVRFVDMAEKDGLFLKEENLQESNLQEALRRHLRSRDVEVREGERLAGGALDLLLPGNMVVENKVHRGKTANPLEAGPHYPWQARRYGQAVCQQVIFSVVAYQPTDESARLPLSQRIVVRKMEGAPEACAEVRLVIPYGESVPSRAKAPAPPDSQ